MQNKKTSSSPARELVSEWVQETVCDVDLIWWYIGLSEWNDSPLSLIRSCCIYIYIYTVAWWCVVTTEVEQGAIISVRTKAKLDNEAVSQVLFKMTLKVLSVQFNKFHPTSACVYKVVFTCIRSCRPLDVSVNMIKSFCIWSTHSFTLRTQKQIDQSIVHSSDGKFPKHK